MHGRAARALANQTVPYSVCTILRDQDIYNPLELANSETASNAASTSVSSGAGTSAGTSDRRDVRSRYNGRLFISWLQDVDDKWEKIKVSVCHIFLGHFKINFMLKPKGATMWFRGP